MSARRAPDAWVERAACRGHGELFAVPEGAGSLSPTWQRQIACACALCAECEVLQPCHDWAMSNPDPAVGLIAAGLTPDDRRRRRRAARRRA